MQFCGRQQQQVGCLQGKKLRDSLLQAALIPASLDSEAVSAVLHVMPR